MTTATKHPVPDTAILLGTRVVFGTHSLTGKSLAYTVAVYDTQTHDMSGRWIVALNGCVIRWYAMQTPAMRCLKKACVGAYGFSFGEAF